MTTHYHLESTGRLHLRGHSFTEREAAEEVLRLLMHVLKRTSHVIVSCDDPVCRFADIADDADEDADFEATKNMTDEEADAYLWANARRWEGKP